MNAIAQVSVCDWDGNPAYRPLAGIGQGLIVGKGFAPRERDEPSEDTYTAAVAVWKLVNSRGVKNPDVRAFWTDCCDYRHLIFHNGKDCRLLNRAPGVAAGYREAISLEPVRVAEISAAQSQTIEVVRYNRDVVVGEWVDPEQTNKFSKTPEKVRAFRRVDTLVRLLAGGTLTKEHVAAGFRLRDDYELAEGARPGSERSEVRGTNVGGPADAQIAAVARYRNAVQAVGKSLCSMVLHVVLDNRSITAWAEPRGKSVSECTGYLLAGMDRLVEHYGEALSAHELSRAEEA